MNGAPRPRHPGFVRVTHWVTTLSFLALLLSGVEILISHPRFYWGDTGNVNVQPLFTLPLPASRNIVPTGYDYVLPDQNGWSRNLHFEAAWVVVLTGGLYAVLGWLGGHFRRRLLPAWADLAPQALGGQVARHLRFWRTDLDDGRSYNVLQRLTYLLVVFVLFPLVIWTGLDMSPAFTSLVPGAVTVLGGRQTARTLHFVVTILLVGFLAVHVLMVYLAGFKDRVGAMVTGRNPSSEERT